VNPRNNCAPFVAANARPVTAFLPTPLVGLSTGAVTLMTTVCTPEVAIS
jgi:hypothetical protein